MINNKILALKYRPQEFGDLIGQEVITQTITNGIKLEKTPYKAIEKEIGLRLDGYYTISRFFIHRRKTTHYHLIYLA